MKIKYLPKDLRNFNYDAFIRDLKSISVGVPRKIFYEQVGVSKATISRLQHKMHIPELHTILVICENLGLSPKDYFNK